MTKINQCVTESIVKDDALDERIDINLSKDGLTYNDILKDTDVLIGNLKLSIAKETLQIKIYERLKKRIWERMLNEKQEPKG